MTTPPETPKAVETYARAAAFNARALRALTPAGTVDDLDAVRAAHDDSSQEYALWGRDLVLYRRLAHQERPDLFVRSLLASSQAGTARQRAHMLRALTPAGTLADVYAARPVLSQKHGRGVRAMRLLEDERPDLAPQAREWVAVLDAFPDVPRTFLTHVRRELRPIFTLKNAAFPNDPPFSATHSIRQRWLDHVTREATTLGLHGPLTDALVWLVENGIARGSSARYHGVMRVIRAAALSNHGLLELPDLDPFAGASRTPERMEELLSVAVATPPEGGVVAYTTAWRHVLRACMNPMGDTTPVWLDRAIDLLSKSAPQPPLTRLVVGLDLYGAGFPERGVEVWRMG